MAFLQNALTGLFPFYCLSNVFDAFWSYMKSTWSTDIRALSTTQSSECNKQRPEYCRGSWFTWFSSSRPFSFALRPLIAAAKMTQSRGNFENYTKVCTEVNLHSSLFRERCYLTTWTAACTVQSLILICINKLCVHFRNANVKEHAVTFPFAEGILST